MYAWANRADTLVIDEPMYAYYLKKTGIDYHPGTKEILAALPHEWSHVIDDLIFPTIEEDIYFIKGMAHHYLDDDLSFLLQLKNVFLIRDPKQLISSFSKVIEQPTMEDIGLKREWELYNYLVERGHNPLVLDSNQVLSNPEMELRKLCKYVGVDFDFKMLSWEAGAIAEDGVWAPYWYANVWKSTGWRAPDNSKRELNNSLLPLYEESLLYYNKLKFT